MTAQSLLSAPYQLFLWTVPFLIVLGVIVTVHELGHFLAARWLGVSVQTFSIGFGKEIAGFYDRHGTRWRVAWIPLGGYVKFKGDETVSSLPSREDIEALTPAQKAGNFHTAPLWRRTLIILAGPFANFLLSILIFLGLFLFLGKPVVQPRLDSVVAGSAAEQAGLRPGDLILAVNGSSVESFDDVQRRVILKAGSEIDLTVERGGKILNLKATPQLTEKECIGRLGIGRSNKEGDMTIRRFTVAEAASASLAETWYWIEQPFQFFGQLFNRQACVKQLGGPVMILETSKTMASRGFLNLIPLIAFLSVSVGLFNLFPIPVLDGGHLLFYGAEAILGRPLSQKSQEIGQTIGLGLLLMLISVVTVNNVRDLIRREPPGQAATSGPEAPK